MMMKTQITALIILFLFFLGTPLHAEYEDKLLGSRALGMAGAFVGVADDATSVNWNPAGMGQIEGLQITTMHTKLFEIDDLVMDYVAGVQPVGWLDATVGVSWLRFGNRKYREKTYTLSFSKKVGDGHHLGLGFNQYISTIEQTPRREGFGLDIGLFIKVADKIRLGIMGHDLNHPEVNEELPPIGKIGLALKPFPSLVLALDVVAEKDQPLSWHLGEEYWVSKNFAVRGGYSSNPERFALGFGFKLFQWLIDYAYQSHTVLEATHRISVSIDLGLDKFRLKDIMTKPVPREKKKKAEKAEEIELKDIYVEKLDKIDLNTATPDDLVKIPGVEPRIANNIVLYRSLNGPFKTVEDLLEVPGIGMKLLEKISPLVKIGR